MNAWTTLIGTLAVDRKPIKVPRKRPSRAMTDLSRKEICALANAVMVEKRKSMRDATKHLVYGETVSPITAQAIADRIKVAKTHVRSILLELIDEGKIKRTKGCIQTYYYERT